MMPTPSWAAAGSAALTRGIRVSDEVVEGSLCLRSGVARHATLVGGVIGTSVVALCNPLAPARTLAPTLLVLLLAGTASSSRSGRGALLRFTHSIVAVLYHAGGAIGVWITLNLTAAMRANLPSLAIAALASWAAAALARHAAAAAPARIAVIGDGHSAEQLRCDLLAAGIEDHVIVGIVAPGPTTLAPTNGRIPVLGTIVTLMEILDRHAVDMLLIGGEASGPETYDHVADTCLGSAMRVCDVTHFYEDVLGHVPVTEIGSAWFRYVMHPRFRSPDTAAKRALDLAVAVAAGVVFLPVVGLCALLVKLEDGGPVLFRQRRIGNRGQEFTLLKLRTMRAAPPVARWSSRDDDRVTRIGRVLRRTHLDEIPQLLNVVRGEMSVVGPRPEQPAFVEHLERTLPYYSRRHLIKPGLTGWAQVRCGYAGSDAESAWKLCHDLYYLKHQSISLDLAILVETVRTLVADRQFRGDAPGQALAPGDAAQPAASAVVERALEVGGIDRAAGADRGSHPVDQLLARIQPRGTVERSQRRRLLAGRGVQPTELELGEPVARLALKRSGERVRRGGAVAHPQCEDAAREERTGGEGIDPGCLVEA
jgi:exopolysaccharide biosynthesis polyprenyl glycosylphosphotransferase